VREQRGVAVFVQSAGTDRSRVSARSAPAARWPPSAPPASPHARSISARTSNSLPAHAPVRPIARGRPTTRKHAPSRAQDRAPHAARTAAVAPAYAPPRRSAPTSACSPPPPTSPASPSSDSPANPPDGRSRPAEPRYGPGEPPATPPAPRDEHRPPTLRQPTPDCTDDHPPACPGRNLDSAPCRPFGTSLLGA
jgi:hypothetical protein